MTGGGEPPGDGEPPFQGIAEVSPDGIFRTDTAGEFTYLSPASEEQLGDDADALLGRAFHEFVAEESLPDAAAGFGRVLEGETVEALPVTLTDADGQRLDVEVSASPVREDGEVVGVQGVSRDVTERKRRERERRREERRYRTIVDNFPDGGVFLFDSELRYVLAGGDELAAVGLTSSEMEGQTPSDLFPPDIAAETEAAYRAALDGEARSFEQHYRGNHYRVETRPLPAEPGLGLAISRNVTERRERERKLEGLRERSRELMHTRTKAETAREAVETANEVIGAPLSGVNLLNDAGDRLASAATVDAVREQFGEPPSYDRGRPEGSRAALVWETFESGDLLRIDDTAADERVTEPTPAGSVLVYPLGDHGVFIVSAPEPDAWDESDVALAEILATTLTAALDRVEREQRLRERERRLERLHEATRELVRAEDRDAIARGVVSAAEDILGFSIVLVRFYDPDAGPGDEGGLVPVAASDPVADILGERAVFTAAGGSLNWRAYEAGEVHRYDDIDDVEGAVDADTAVKSLMLLPLGRFGTLALGETRPAAFDETDDFLARILATAAETAIETTEQAAELRDQRNELRRKNERLEEFARVVSHDLRNPLMVARGNLDLVRDAHPEPGEALSATDDALARMDGMITDLLTLAREGGQLGDVATVSLPDVAREAWAYVETGGATLAVETEALVRADRDRLLQLLENLFRNSMEHASDDPSGVTVTVGDCPDGFDVADDGRGIPADEREAVLETGYSTDPGGTGFGLAIVAEIGDAHGWDLSVGASEDGGARFAFAGVERVE